MLNKLKVLEGVRTVFIIANIEWNDYGWTKPQIPEKPTFSYVKEGNMPHDTLNFMFNKPVDTGDTVYGYFEIRGQPREFVRSSAKNKMIFFYSRHKIVGVYGGAEFLDKRKEYPHSSFQNGRQELNISGKRDLSLGFLNEVYLESKPEHMNNKQMGRSNLIYINSASAKKILLDATEKYSEVIKTEPDNTEAKEHLKKLERLCQTLLTLEPSLREQGANFSELLSKKKQVILYGPPGTGKTFRAQKLAVDFLFKKTARGLTRVGDK